MCERARKAETLEVQGGVRVGARLPETLLSRDLDQKEYVSASDFKASQRAAVDRHFFEQGELGDNLQALRLRG